MARDFAEAPGDGELWKVGGTHYLAYTVPDLNPPVWMTWRVEDNERLEAIVGGPGGSKTPDRTLTREQFNKMGALSFGGSKDLTNVKDHPFDGFLKNYEVEAQIQPWLRDPEVLATIHAGELEGLDQAQVKRHLSQTDYFQNISQQERDWIVLRATDPRRAKVEEADKQRAVRELLRSRGVSDAPDGVVKLLAGRWAGGRWTESFVRDQVTGLADPTAGVDLAPEVVDAGRGFDPSSGDTAAIAGGRDSTIQRVKRMFVNRDLPIATEDETEDERLNRIADEIEDGRSLNDVRRSLDDQAGLHPVTGRDITREGEDEVRALAARWLGPVAGKWDDRKVREWAGRMRNDPDAKTELVETLLKPRRLSMLKNYDENLTYEDIIEPVRNMAVNIWQQPIQDETLLVDLANMDDYTEMQAKLRKEGRLRRIPGVTQTLASDMNRITGGSVRASAQ